MSFVFYVRTSCKLGTNILFLYWSRFFSMLYLRYFTTVRVCVHVDSQVFGGVEEQQRADGGDVTWQATQPFFRLILWLLLVAGTHREVDQLLLPGRQTMGDEVTFINSASKCFCGTYWSIWWKTNIIANFCALSATPNYPATFQVSRHCWSSSR